MTIDLNTATDAEINSLVAEHVAGWTNIRPAHVKGGILLPAVWWDKEGRPQHSDNFTTDANAVLELLEKAGYWSTTYNSGDHLKREERIWATVYVPETKQEYEAYAATFPRAACLALLRAKGWDEPG